MDVINNELFETDIIDDIEAGAISDVVKLRSPSNRSKAASSSSEVLHFNCRYFYHNQRDGKLEPIQAFSKTAILERGASVTYFDYAYVDCTDDMDDFSKEFSDIYSQAARRLHVSVLPNTLLCREKYEKIYN